MQVAIAGATGFVGSRLVERLLAEGHQILALTRNASHAKSKFAGFQTPALKVLEANLTEPGDWQAQLSGCDGVVNLAGQPIAETRWTAALKGEILSSRQLATRNIVAAIAQANPRPQVLVNASAIGYYGSSETACFDESSENGSDFLAQVCQLWETEAKAVQATGVRLAILRIGIVLANGGAIAKMLPPFQLFAGGPIGTGQQWFSWIHRDDLVSLIQFALTDLTVNGVFNATAPNPVRMTELCQILGDVISRPSWLPVPDVALKMLLGEGAQVVLEGQHVLPKQTLATGFQYQYPQIKPALAEFLAR